jgi:hypothetical protein
MRATTRILAPVAASLAIVCLLAAPASAGKPSGGGGKGGGKPPGGGSSSLTLKMVDPSDTVVNYGDVITFNVSTTATSRPAVSLECKQGGTVVYTASAGFYPEWPWSKEFTLRSGAWTGGAADCSARLYSTSADGLQTTTLATLAIHANA